MVNQTLRLYAHMRDGSEINTEIAQGFGIHGLQNVVERLRQYTTRKIKEHYRTLNGKRVRWYVMS